jgi:4-carboxymuconolactone decarboxylase
MPLPRIPDLDESTLSSEQRRVYDLIRSGPRGVVQGPLRVWLTSPDFAERAQSLGAYCRYHTCLEPRLSELAIITVGAHWRAGFEWAVHAPIAERAGISSAAIAAIKGGLESSLDESALKDDESAVYAFTRELLVMHEVRAVTFERLTALIGQKGAVDLVGILGYYSLICMTINAFQVPVPLGTPEPFASPD